MGERTETKLEGYKIRKGGRVDAKTDLGFVDIHRERRRLSDYIQVIATCFAQTSKTDQSGQVPNWETSS